VADSPSVTKPIFLYGQDDKDTLFITNMGFVALMAVNINMSCSLVKVKVKFSPEQAMKAQWGCRDIALLFVVW
jgi:hypothetical protein